MQEALASRNPWQALKAAASRPTTHFRWISSDELNNHIAVEAQREHGAFIPNPKQKKAKSDKRGAVNLNFRSALSTSSSPLAHLFMIMTILCSRSLLFLSTGYRLMSILSAVTRRSRWLAIGNSAAHKAAVFAYQSRPTSFLDNWSAADKYFRHWRSVWRPYTPALKTAQQPEPNPSDDPAADEDCNRPVRSGLRATAHGQTSCRCIGAKPL